MRAGQGRESSRIIGFQVLMDAVEYGNDEDEDEEEKAKFDDAIYYQLCTI